MPQFNDIKQNYSVPVLRTTLLKQKKITIKQLAMVW